VDPLTAGVAGSRTTVVDASPRPPRENVQIVTDTGEGGSTLAEYLIERGLA